MRVVGLDLSLTATGYADEAGSAVIKVRSRGPERLCAIRDEIMRRMCQTPPVSDLDGGRPLVVIEGYSFASKFKGELMGELGGVIRTLLWEQAIPYAEVPPTVLKKFATGKGNAGKDEVLACAIRRWGFLGADNNEADAHLLRRMGLARYELWDALPAYVREALAKVEWPEFVTETIA